MKKLLGVGAAILGLTLSLPALADDEPKNLKVVDVPEKDLEKSMKGLAKGFGVKCVACHVKGKWDSDEVAAKEKARAFLEAAVENADKAKREAALKELLPHLKLEKAANDAELWKAVDLLKKKKKA